MTLTAKAVLAVDARGDDVHGLTYQRLKHIAEWLEWAHGITIDDSVINWIMLGDDAVGEEPEAGQP